MSTDGSRPPPSPLLRGLTVAVTRPAHQAAPTCAALRAAGAEVIHYPVLAIEALKSPPELSALRRARLVIFISANAVRFGVPILKEQGGLAPGTQVAAVGAATAAALRDAGLTVEVCPDTGFDSEALLQTEALRSVQGRTVLIVRGQGGRELLAESLRARGAEVHYAEVYRRTCIRPDGNLLEACWRSPRSVILVTSSDGLQCLLQAGGPSQQRHLLGTPLAVIGERMLKQARNMGFQSDIVVTEPGEQALIEALGAWCGRDRHPRTNQE